MEKNLKKALAEAAKFKELSALDKLKLREERRDEALKEHVKKVAKRAAAFGGFLKKRKQQKFQGMLMLVGFIALFLRNKLKLKAIDVAIITGTTFFIAIKLIINMFKASRNDIARLLRNKHTRLFLRVYQPATQNKKGAKWRKPSEISAAIEKRTGKKVTPKDMGKALTKFCIKIHRKYLIKCI